MKTSIIIFIFLLQALCLSASAMNETPIPADSSSEKKVIVLNDDSEIIGKILTQTKDSMNILTENGIIIQISVNSISNIYKHNYFVKNIIYIDAASIIISSYVNANYELMLNPNLSVRFGAGIGYSTGGFTGPSHNYQGISCMINFLPGKNISKYELGIGVYYIKEEIEYNNSEFKTKFGIAFSVGYRYQNKYGGMIFRTGFSSLGYGIGFHLSLGYAF